MRRSKLPSSWATACATRITAVCRSVDLAVWPSTTRCASEQQPGRTFLANPDLPERLRTGAPLNQDDMKTWYSQGPEGYIDYLALETTGETVAA